MATIVYRFGLLAPSTNATLARRHLRAAHRYRNLLIEIERGRRAALRAAELRFPVLAGVEAAFQWLDANCKSLADEAKRWRSKSRKRRLPKQMAKAIREAKELRRRARIGRGLLRAFAVVFGGLQDERDAINELARGLRRNLRQHRRAMTGEQLYHGTYTAIEDADGAARRSLPLHTSPRFVRSRARPMANDIWAQSGSLGVQIQGGASPGDVMGEHTQLQLLNTAPMSPRPCRPGRPGVHRKCTADKCTIHERDPSRKRSSPRHDFRILRLRQESDADRRPIWVEWPIRMHRPFPEDARIMRAQAHCRVIATDMGPKEEWYATFTLRVPDAPRRNDGLAVAVDVGWRLHDDGSMRVAYWRGEDGRHGELTLSPRQLEGLTKGDSIRSIRDRHMETLRTQLKDAITANDPKWLLTARSRLRLWRSSARFHDLLRDWKHRVAQNPSCPPIFPALSEWAHRDHHLAGYEHGQRRGAEGNRKCLYRNFAAELNGRYDVVVLEKFDKRQVNRTKRTEDGAQTEDVKLHATQRLAATSVLCSVLKSRFGQHGKWVEVAAENTTLFCAVTGCTAALDGDPADGIMQVCSAGHSWDQDDNACKNLLKLYRDSPGNDEDPGTAREDNSAKSESRWGRARRLRAEREQRMATARETEANVTE